MSYCSIEEAWGSSQLLNKPKKSKNKHRNRYRDNYNTHNKYNFMDHSNQSKTYKANSTRGIHNRLTRKNRFVTKNINQDEFDLQVSSAPESNKLRQNNKKVLIPSPVSLNDDYDNYQELDYQLEDKTLLDEYAESNYIDTNNNLEIMNNQEMMPNSDCMSVASYDDLEDNYHEMGTDRYAPVNLEDEVIQNNLQDNVQEESEVSQEDDSILEGFQNSNNDNDNNNDNLNNTNNNINSNINNNELAHIMDRLDNLEKMIKQKKTDNNNVHDIILFIIIGIFILFALDSIFKIGRGTV